MTERYEIQVVAPSGNEARHTTDSLAVATVLYQKFVEHRPAYEVHLHDLETSETLHSRVPEGML